MYESLNIVCFGSWIYLTFHVFKIYVELEDLLRYVCYVSLCMVIMLLYGSMSYVALPSFMIPLMFYGSLRYVALLSFMTPITLYTYMSCLLYCDTRVECKMSLHGFKTQR